MVEFIGSQAPAHIRRAHHTAWNVIQNEYHGPFEVEFVNAVRNFVFSVEEAPYDFLVLQALRDLHNEFSKIAERSAGAADALAAQNRYLGVLSEQLALP